MVLISLLKWLLRDDVAERNERIEYRSHLEASIDPETEVALPAEQEARLLAEVEAAVKRRLADPDSARIDDCSIYDQGLGCYLVCGRVESCTVAGTLACNYFVAETDAQPKVIGCEIVATDPRNRSDVS